MNQLPFVGPAQFKIRDPLDRCYTPDTLAAACVVRLMSTVGVLSPGRWVEPSVGGGAFVRALKSHEGYRRMGGRVFGIDIDPDAAGLCGCDESRVGDWAQGASYITDVRLICGNPPFAVALQHVLTARKEHPDAPIGLIMPLAYLGVKKWQPVFREHPLAELHPIIGRPWPKRVRETAFYVWLPGRISRCSMMGGVSW